MAAEAQRLKEPGVVTITAPSALTSGQVIQLADGRAGIVAALAGFASGALSSLQVSGIFKVAKTASINLLDGQEVWWNAAANTASYTGDYPIGTAVGDSLAAATHVNVELNARVNPRITLERGEWITEAALGLGVIQVANSFRLEFDAVAEIAQAALYSRDLIDVDDKPIFEGWVAPFAIGDNAALDMDFGLAVASHASDFEAIAQFAAFHFDGNSLNILAHSDDGTTDVAPVDTTVDAVDDTYAFFQIDCRNKADVQLYVNGVNVLPATTFTLAAHTGNLRPIALIEKTSDDTVADLRVKSMHVRTGIKT